MHSKSSIKLAVICKWLFEKAVGQRDDLTMLKMSERTFSIMKAVHVGIAETNVLRRQCHRKEAV